jgi:murein DD-endopeptidase MepM/ murein hydrolase activator NlpD
MSRTEGNRLKALAGGAAMACVLAGSAAMMPGTTASAAPVAVAASSAVFGMTVWSPMRTPARVNCVRTNCPGPYHGDWAIDFIDTDRSTLDPLYAVAPGIVHIGALIGNNTCAMPVNYGSWVWIDHGEGRTTRYTHLHGVLVKEGQRVTPRTRLGSMGHNGNRPPCLANYLHMEFRVNNVKVPPPDMLACVGTKRVTMPASLGYAEWNLVPTNQNPKTGLKPNIFTHPSTNACLP